MSSGLRLPDFGRSRALLIGVSTFDHPKLEDMPGVSGNIAGLVKVLTDPVRSGFPEQHIVTVENPQNPTDVMTPAMALSAAAEDVLLLYVATHGLLMGDNGELHLALSGSRTREPWTALQFVYLAEALNESRAPTKLMILDCCYSGRAPKNLMASEEALIADQTAVDGVYVMTATSGTKRAKAPVGEPYTAFSGLLLAAMNEGVPGAGPLLGMRQLFASVLSATRSRPKWPLPQEYRKNSADNIALVRNTAAGRIAVSPLPTAPALDHSRSRAVIVGVQTYDDPHFSMLSSPGNDVQLVTDCLLNPEIFGMAPEHCTVLLDPANRDEILTAIAEAADEAEDLLLLYYSGHAFLSPRRDVSLVPRQFSQVRPWTGVTAGDLADVLWGFRVRASVTLVDACFGHGLAESFRAFRDSYVLSAASRTQLAFERDGHGIFTRNVVDVLTRGVPGGPPHLSAIDLITVLDGHEREVSSRPVLSAFNVTTPRCLFRNRSPETDWLRPHSCLMVE